MSTEASRMLLATSKLEAAPTEDGAAKAPQDDAGAGSPAQQSPPAGSPHGSPAGMSQTPQAAHQHQAAQPPPTRTHAGAAQVAAGPGAGALAPPAAPLAGAPTPTHPTVPRDQSASHPALPPAKLAAPPDAPQDAQAPAGTHAPPTGAAAALSQPALAGGDRDNRDPPPAPVKGTRDTTVGAGAAGLPATPVDPAATKPAAATAQAGGGQRTRPALHISGWESLYRNNADTGVSILEKV